MAENSQESPNEHDKKLATPTIVIGSFDCISLDENAWGKQMEAFDSIAKSLPCDHIGTSESTSDIPIALESLSSASPALHRTHANGLNLECHSATDVSSQTKRDDISDIFPSSGNDDCLSAFSNPEMSCGKDCIDESKKDNTFNALSMETPDQCHSAQCLNTKNESGYGKYQPSRQQSLLSVGSSASRGSSYSSIFGSAFFVSSRKGSASSLQRINIVAEAACMVPSVVSHYYLEEEIGQSLSTRNVFLQNGGNAFNSTASYQDKLDSLDCTAASNDDSNVDGHFLKRSVSVPPKYEYHTQTKRKIVHVKEIFQDFLKKEEKEEPIEKEEFIEDLPVPDLKSSKKKKVPTATLR